MVILLFLSSGLFLGWSLGANDAANIFGTAVGSRMLKFKKAALIASIFVILGAVFQGAGASDTLGKLGSVNTLAAAFTVALAAALTVYWMTRLSLPVSTSQAIVGAIIGWNFYTNNPTDISVLSKIVSTWISGPILGGIFAALLFLLLSRLLLRMKIHLLLRDAYLRISLIVVGAFGAYSLGANNIANVMGVFTDAVQLPLIDLGIWEISSKQQLFFIGGVAIAIGIITYSKHVMQTVGNTLMPLSPEAALVVVLSQALVLFIFSSSSLSEFVQMIGLPAIPLVPVSSSQVVIGSIIGIGLLKGGKEIKFNILGSISLGWIATPVAAGMLSFFMLFFVNNVFKQDVGQIISLEANQKMQDDKVLVLDKLKTELKADIKNQEIQDEKIIQTERQGGIPYFAIPAILLLLVCSIYIVYLRHKIKQIRHQKEQEIKILQEEKDCESVHLKRSLEAYQDKQESLDKELNFRQKEMTTMAMNIIRNNEFLNGLKKEIAQIKNDVPNQKAREAFNKLVLMISQNISIDRERDNFRMYLNEQNSKFLQKLDELFPGLTDNEKRLAVLLRLKLSSKEIASILNISPKSVEMNRYRLRKKLKVEAGIQLSDFIREI